LKLNWKKEIMINIPIDSKNIKLRDTHIQKIYFRILRPLIRKRNSIPIVRIEYQLLNWIILNIKDILIGDVSTLRALISNYNNLLTSFPIVSTFNYKKLTVKDLETILEENNLNFRGNKKRAYQRYLLQNRTRITCLNHILTIQYRDKFYEILEEFFIKFYNDKWDKIKGYDRYFFVMNHNLQTCPYCNRNYIFTVNKKKNRLRPEIDHFYPKSIYPFLAMSFYNLIPCCQICNHTKKDKDAFKDNLKSPYEMNFFDFKFKYKPKNISFYQINKNKYVEERFDIILNKTNSVETNDEYFKLNLLYEQHKDIVLDLLLKKTIYTKSYIKELKENFKLKDDEIYRFLFCNYLKDEDLHKRPLSKLIRDISKDIGLI